MSYGVRPGEREFERNCFCSIVDVASCKDDNVVSRQLAWRSCPVQLSESFGEILIRVTETYPHATSYWMGIRETVF